MRTVILLALGACAVYAQPFSAGVKVGLPMTDFIDAVNSGNYSASSYTNRYIVGAMAELRLPLGLSIEGDVLYRHFGYQSVLMLIDVVQNSRTTSNNWEFPLLVKYKFPSKIVRPYVEGGVAWDTLQGLTDTITSTAIPGNRTTTTSTSSPAELKNSTTMGVVLGVGVEVKALVIKIAPEIRYTRWTDQHISLQSVFNSNQNQAEFLVGITF